MDPAKDELRSRMSAWRKLIDRELDQLLATVAGCPERLCEAMRYSVLAGGKRLRPMLVMLAAEALGGGIETAFPAACAVELTHTYSLIHDDLPAMDNDDLRRGLPTCHKKFDEATAILAGDALLTLAFEVLARLQPAVTASRCIGILAHGAGRAGMVGGQVDDLNPTAEPSEAWLESLHRRKTGALLVASLRMGGAIAGADEAADRALTDYGRHIGLAFQIADDLLDVTGETAKLGKQVRKDQEAGKLTFPGVIGLEASRRRAVQLAHDARESLRGLGRQGRYLAALADYVVERES